MIGSFRITRAGSYTFTENTTTGVGVAYLLDDDDLSGTEQDFLRIRKKLDYNFLTSAVTTSVDGGISNSVITFDLGSTTSANTRTIKFIGGLSQYELIKLTIGASDAVYIPHFEKGITSNGYAITARAVGSADPWIIDNLGNIKGTTLAVSTKFNVDANGNITKLNNLTYSFPAAHTTNGYLKNNGSGTLTWEALSSMANPMTTLGDVIYGGASGAATRLAGNTTTTKKYLQQTGDGSASAAPVWATIAFSELTSKPTTISGYGITDAVTLAGDQTITGAKTFSTGGINVSAGADLNLYGRLVSQANSILILPSSLQGTASGSVWFDGSDLKAYTGLATVTFSKNGHDHTFASLTSKPTTISGYGITDAVTLAGNNSLSGNNTFTGSIMFDNEVEKTVDGDDTQSVSGKNTIIILCVTSGTLTLTSPTDGQLLFITNEKDSPDPVTITPVRNSANTTLTLTAGKSALLRYRSSESTWYAAQF
jgi:hypothetical protein